MRAQRPCVRTGLTQDEGSTHIRAHGPASAARPSVPDHDGAPGVRRFILHLEAPRFDLHRPSGPDHGGTPGCQTAGGGLPGRPTARGGDYYNTAEASTGRPPLCRQASTAQASPQWGCLKASTLHSAGGATNQRLRVPALEPQQPSNPAAPRISAALRGRDSRRKLLRRLSAHERQLDITRIRSAAGGRPDTVEKPVPAGRQGQNLRSAPIQYSSSRRRRERTRRHIHCVIGRSRRRRGRRWGR
jgi:hypothetical protein